jgi:hypothetical protein
MTRLMLQVVCFMLTGDMPFPVQVS